MKRVTFGGKVDAKKKLEIERAAEGAGLTMSDYFLACYEFAKGKIHAETLTPPDLEIPTQDAKSPDLSSVSVIPPGPDNPFGVPIAVEGAGTNKAAWKKANPRTPLSIIRDIESGQDVSEGDLRKVEVYQKVRKTELEIQIMLDKNYREKKQVETRAESKPRRQIDLDQCPRCRGHFDSLSSYQRRMHFDFCIGTFPYPPAWIEEFVCASELE